MQIEDFLPSRQWLEDPKKIAATLGFALPFVWFIPILGPLGGLLWWRHIIVKFMELQRDRKIRAIIGCFGSKYSEGGLRELFSADRAEFNRIYKLASDEFFLKYVREQADHRKAQELIERLQRQIDEMRLRLNELAEHEKRNVDVIRELKNDIELYESILARWKQGRS